MAIGMMRNIPATETVSPVAEAAALPNDSQIDEILIAKVTALPIEAKQALLKILDKLPGGEQTPVSGQSTGMDTALSNRFSGQ